MEGVPVQGPCLLPRMEDMLWPKHKVREQLCRTSEWHPVTLSRAWQESQGCVLIFDLWELSIPLWVMVIDGFF